MLLEKLFGEVEEGFVCVFAQPTNPSHYPRETFLSVDNVPGIMNVAEALEVNHDVYFSICALDHKPAKGRGTSSDVGAMSCLWVDIDHEEGKHSQGKPLFKTFEAALGFVDGLPTPPSVVINSGGGLHCYWLFREPWELVDERERRTALKAIQDWQDALRTMASAQNAWIDNTSDLARVFRVPGTMNHKVGKRVEVVYENGPTYNLSDFGWIRDLRIEGIEAASTLTVDNTSSTSSGRNDRLKEVVHSMFHRGEGVDAILAEVLSVDSKFTTPLFSDRSERASFLTNDPKVNALLFVSRNIQSAQRFVDSSGKASPFLVASVAGGVETRTIEEVFTFHDMVDLITDTTPPPPDYVSQLLGEGELHVIAGPPKSQKSLLLGTMATQTGLGEDYFQFKTLRPLKWLVLNAELNLAKARGRFNLRQFTSEELDRLRGNVIFTGRFRYRWNLALRDSLAALLKSKMVPDVIAVDTLQNLYTGNENDQAELNAFIDQMLVFRDMVNPLACLIIVHHANKLSKSDIESNPFNSIRGSGALRGRMDSGQFILQTPGKDKSAIRDLFFETRYGIEPPNKRVLFERGYFVDLGEVDSFADSLESSLGELKISVAQQLGVLLDRKEFVTKSELVNRCLALPRFKGIDRKQVWRAIDEELKDGVYYLGDGEELDAPKPSARSHGWILPTKKEK